MVTHSTVHIGALLEATLHAHNVTAQWLATDQGVTDSTVSRWIHKADWPDREVVQRWPAWVLAGVLARLIHTNPSLRDQLFVMERDEWQPLALLMRVMATADLPQCDTARVA